jgi:hypothetical protein
MLNGAKGNKCNKSIHFYNIKLVLAFLRKNYFIELTRLANRGYESLLEHYLGYPEQLSLLFGLN